MIQLHPAQPQAENSASSRQISSLGMGTVSHRITAITSPVEDKDPLPISDMGYRGLVIAGTGLGHVNKPLYPAIKRAVQKGMTVVMTVQTIWGFAQMYVYDTDRDLLDLGIIPLDNMLTETAYMKLAWVLGQTDDPNRIRQMMTTPINHEITPREPHNGYLILQGGLADVDAFVLKHWK
jgi:glutamyl-tRNA(Gln) amidotransferase subunit D